MQGSIGSHPHLAQQQNAAMVRAQQDYSDKTQAAQIHPGYGQVEGEPKALDALTRALRDIRNTTNIAVTNLNSFLVRATGEGALPPACPPAQLESPRQSPMHEAVELLSETQSALSTLANIQSRVDRIA